MPGLPVCIVDWHAFFRRHLPVFQEPNISTSFTDVATTNVHNFDIPVASCKLILSVNVAPVFYAGSKCCLS